MISFRLCRVILPCLIFTSCGKHEPEIKIPGVIVPVASVTFFSPLNGSVFTAGDSVAIEAKVVSTETMHGYNLEIKKVNDTIIYYTEFFHDHNDTLFLSKKWHVTIAGPQDLEAVITVVLDHDGHTHKARQPFKIQ